MPLAAVLPKLVKQRGLATPSAASAASSRVGTPGDGGGDDGQDTPEGAGARWNASALEDPSSIVSKYVRPASTGAKAATDKKPPAKLTVQQKRLATTDTKGMKTMSSFFGKKPS